MNSNNQKMNILNSHTSKFQRIHRIFLSDPYKIFHTRKLCNVFNSLYKDKIDTGNMSKWLSILWKENKIIRTNTQVKIGYLYSLYNRRLLDDIYQKYLLPYDFDDKEKIINLINKKRFNDLKTNQNLDLGKIKDFDFIKKYGLNYFYDSKVLNFLVINLGFLMCDGHINKNLEQVQYFFNQKKDAVSFKSNFKSIFPHEYLSLKHTMYCFRINLCGKGFSNLFSYLGVPAGNKVFEPFLIPNWIYNGPKEVKRTFLSIIYGNEGSKPQDNRWRIQFVLSKTKEHVINLLEFLNQIRTMLYYFGIDTPHIQLRKQKGREFCGRFYIKGKDNLLKFYNKIGFAYASEKQEVLGSLLKKDKLIN